MGASNKSGGNHTFYSVKTEKDEHDEKYQWPFFYKMVKSQNEWVRGDRYSTYSGKITGINVEEYEYKGKQFKLILIIEDEGETAKIDFPFTSMCRSLINTLCSVETFEVPVELSLYATPNQDAKRKPYSNCVLRQNDEMIRWRFDPKQLPKGEKIGTPSGGEVTDYFKANAYYARLVREVVMKSLAMNTALVRKSETKPEEKPAPAQEQSAGAPFPDAPFPPTGDAKPQGQQPEAGDTESFDDLPF